MASTVKLNAEAKFGKSGQYIARIVGRDDRVQFARSFVGSKFGKRSECTSYETDVPGLYEICDVTKSGKTKSYALVLPWRGGLRRVWSDLEDFLILARRLEDGEFLPDIVRLEAGDPITKEQWFYVCRECRQELPDGSRIDSRCAQHPTAGTDFQSRQVIQRNEDGSPKLELVYRILDKDAARAPMVDDGLADLNPRIAKGLILELALAIEDPASLDAVRMARLIVEMVWNRSPSEIQQLTAELTELATRWQRRLEGI